MARIKLTKAQKEYLSRLFNKYGADPDLYVETIHYLEYNKKYQAGEKFYG